MREACISWWAVHILTIHAVKARGTSDGLLRKVWGPSCYPLQALTCCHALWRRTWCTSTSSICVTCWSLSSHSLQTHLSVCAADAMMFESRPRVSSNSFANGSNQNCGNSIGDIPSTRVAAPPGGKSSLCLGWEAEPQGSTAKTNGHRPRESSNNYASGQSQNTGNVLTGVPTTRVSRPPGGHSEMSLAWGHDSQKAETFGRRVRVSSNSFANGADQNCGNVLSDTPTTRVLRPPGGGSSLNLGWDWNP